MGGKVAEGVLTTRAALGLATYAEHRNADYRRRWMPSCTAARDPREAVAELMRRPGRDEL